MLSIGIILVGPDQVFTFLRAAAVKKAHAMLETPEKWQIAQRIVKEVLCLGS